MKKIFILPIFLLIIFFVRAQGLWIPKTIYPSGVASAQVAFTIDSIGYAFNIDSTNNFFAYNSNTNTWRSRTPFPGSKAAGMAGFAIGQNGYIGAGGITDFWQYNSISDVWTQKASLPDTVSYPFALTINDTGYIFGGADPNVLISGFTYSCFAYNETSDQWIKKPNAQLSDKEGLAITVNGKGYAGIGLTTVFNGLYDNNFWEYNAGTGVWRHLTGFPGTISHYPPISFSIDSQIYIAGASAATFWVYDIPSDTWRTVKGLSSLGTCNYVGSEYAAFTIANHGYLAGIDVCDTSYFKEFDPLSYFKITSLSADTVCMNKTLSATVSTNFNFGNSNTFRIGLTSSNRTPGVYFLSPPVSGNSSGTYTFSIPAGVYNNARPDQVAVFASSPFMHTPYDTVLVNYVQPDALQPNYNTCRGDSQLLVLANVSNNKYYWSTANGVFDSTNYELSVAPSYTTTYYISGFFQTLCPLFDTTVVIVDSVHNNVPNTEFLLCPLTSVPLGNSPLQNCAYFWTDSTGFTSQEVSPAIMDTVTRTYYLTITDTLTTCKANSTIVVNIKQPPGQDLCLITVDTSVSRNLIVWEKLDKAATESYRIYREISTNNYAVIAIIRRDSLSEFADSSANPQASSFRYKISVIDTCGNESALSLYHNTIHLVYSGSGQLQWNDYSIENTTTPITSYDVFIDSLNNGNFITIGNVPGTQNAFTDVNFNQNPLARYLIQANWSYSCNPSRGINTALSNFAYKLITGIQTISEDLVHIYPNPVADQVTVQSTLLASETFPVLCDATGKQLTIPFIRDSEKIIFNTQNLDAGVYFIMVNYNGQQLVKKFAKIN